MSELTPQQVQQLADELALPIYDGLTCEQAYAVLHDPQVVVTTTETLAPFTVEELLAGLSAETKKNLLMWPSLPQLKDAIRDQDRHGVGLWVQFLAAGGLVQPAEAAHVGEILQRTMKVESRETKHARVIADFDSAALYQKYGTVEVPAVANDGSETTRHISNYEGMPNVIAADEFAKVWKDRK